MTSTTVVGADPEAEFGDLAGPADSEPELAEDPVMLVHHHEIENRRVFRTFGHLGDPRLGIGETSVRRNRIPSLDLGIRPRGCEHRRIGRSPRPQSVRVGQSSSGADGRWSSATRTRTPLMKGADRSVEY